MDEQKIKSDAIIAIGENIQQIRQANNIGQTELVRLLDLQGISIARESLVKIERGIQHIHASQFRRIKHALQTGYNELLK